MSESLFKEVRYPLSGLVNGISMGQIGLPWPASATKCR